jgi:hypothetical protein
LIGSACAECGRVRSCHASLAVMVAGGRIQG